MRRIAVLLPVVFAFLVGAAPASAWTWPVEGPVMQPFNVGSNPYAGGQHRGIDIGASSGARVGAPSPGVISFAGTVPRGGLTVTIRTEDGYAVTLVHLGEARVTEGQQVGEGDVVGAVGPSGEAEHATPYVHLGIRIAADENGYVDPLMLLPALTGGRGLPGGSGTGEQPASGEEPEEATPPAEEPPLATGLESPAVGADEGGTGSASPNAPAAVALPDEQDSSNQEERKPDVVPAPSAEVVAPGHGAAGQAMEPPTEEAAGPPGPLAPDAQAADATAPAVPDAVGADPLRPTEHVLGAKEADVDELRSAEESGSPARTPVLPSGTADTTSEGLATLGTAGALGTPVGPRQRQGRAGGTVTSGTPRTGDQVEPDRRLNYGLGALAAVVLAGTALLLWRSAGGPNRARSSHPVQSGPGGVVPTTEGNARSCDHLSPVVASASRAVALPASAPIRAESRLVRLRFVEDLASAA